MTHYSTDRNGITIGWGNIFAYRELDETKYFRSILVFENLYPSNINSLNYNLVSFAEQMVWEERSFAVPTTDQTPGFFDWSYEIKKVVKEWWVNWLDQYTPGWGIRPISLERSNESPCLFFPKVSQARKLRDTIAYHLEGMPPVKTSTLNGKKKK